MKQKILQMMFAALVCAGAHAQVNSGSNGSDGALDFSGITYTTNIVINMADHLNGIYQYTYVNIPTNVTVTFIPNANNTPVYWLVQNNVVINGTVDVSGQIANGNLGGVGGPGGWGGGAGGSITTAGQGPGGGSSSSGYSVGGNASYGSSGGVYNSAYGETQAPSGLTYGNSFLIPLQGGSGGGGGGPGGCGGGGAILIAASNIQLNGLVKSEGGSTIGGGAGSGGAVRLYASRIFGSGGIDVNGGAWSSFYNIYGGAGRVRIDTYEDDFGGSINGVFTAGFQPIIIPTSGQIPQLTVASVGGVPVSASPTGVLSTPDAVISAQQTSPMPVVVNCANLPLGTAITVTIKPMTGSAVSAVGSNNTGTLASSTATISINIPRGGGLIYATAATGN